MPGSIHLSLKLIYFLPFDVSDIDNAYNNYKKVLESLPKHSEYAQGTPEYYGAMIGLNYVIK